MKTKVPSSGVKICFVNKNLKKISHDDGNDDGNIDDGIDILMIQYKNTIIMVSNILGKDLNHSDDFRWADASRKMILKTVTLRNNENDISLNASCFCQGKIRCFINDTTHNMISVHDIDTNNTSGNNELILVKGVLSENASNNNIHFIRLGEENLDLVVLLKENNKCITWYDTTSLEVVGTYTIPDTDGRDTIFDMTPVHSIHIENATTIISMALSMQTSSGFGIQILQSYIMKIEHDVDVSTSPPKKEGDSNKRFKRSSSIQLSKPHIVYNLPLSTTSLSDIRLCSLSNTKSRTSPYSIRYSLLHTNNGRIEYYEFCPQDADIVGKFRYFISEEKFDQADELLSNNSISTKENNTMHGSEVALGKFRQLLKSTTMKNHENKDSSSSVLMMMSQAKECLRRLATGAVSGGKESYLLQASQELRQWPSNASNLKIQDVQIALSAMSKTISSLIVSITPNQKSTFQQELKQIQKQINALECIQNALSSNNSTNIYLSPPFSSVKSPVDVFRICVSQGYLTVAEKVRKSLSSLSASEDITAEHIASSILNISSNLDPRQYTFWIRDAVIPELNSVNHPIMEDIRSWACRMADDFDDPANSEKFDIGSSIHLLQVCVTHHKSIRLFY